MSLDWFEDISEFHREVMLDVFPKFPNIPDGDKKKLRRNLIIEEVEETLSAIERDDVAQVADGIVDSIVVLLGTAVTYGIDIRPIWDEVHRTNMAKKGGTLRSDGKRLKPRGWKGPDIETLLLEQGWDKREDEAGD